MKFQPMKFQPVKLPNTKSRGLKNENWLFFSAPSSYLLTGLFCSIVYGNGIMSNEGRRIEIDTLLRPTSTSTKRKRTKKQARQAQEDKQDRIQR